MKEATGEANMTVITIVLIAIVLAVGTPLIRSLMENTKKSSCCQTSGGIWEGGKCYKPDATTGKATTTEMTPSCDEPTNGTPAKK